MTWARWGIEANGSAEIRYFSLLFLTPAVGSPMTHRDFFAYRMCAFLIPLCDVVPVVRMRRKTCLAFKIRLR